MLLKFDYLLLNVSAIVVQQKLEKVLCTQDIYLVYKGMVENIIYAFSIIHTTNKIEHFLTVSSS